MLVLRELAYGPRRFSELKSDLQGISANVLTQRLTDLEARGLVRKTKLPPPASVQVYEATEWGLEAVPVIASLLMSLQTLISPERAAGFNARVCFRLGEAAYVATVNDGRLAVDRRSADDCDVTLTGTPTAVAAVIHGGAPFDTIRVEGDMDLAKRFTTLFPLPPKVG